MRLSLSERLNAMPMLRCWQAQNAKLARSNPFGARVALFGCSLRVRAFTLHCVAVVVVD